MKDGNDAAYVGESSRTTFERASDHLKYYNDKLKGSHMYSHALAKHEGRTDIKWKLKVIGNFQFSFTRQLSEEARIRRSGEENVQNEKGVYNRCAVPEIAVVHNDKI